jgi:hypothetical protein
VSETLIDKAATQKRWIGVAVLDWASPALASFYPTDVPQDWQLTWYANWCMAVVLPSSRWLAADAAVCAQWSEQTQDNFWFYLFCESSEQLKQAAQLAPAFNGKCAGLIVAQDAAVELCSIPVLRLGDSVLFCHADGLRMARAQIDAWLKDFTGEHGLIMLDGQIVSQIKEVQTLLELMGVLS